MKLPRRGIILSLSLLLFAGGLVAVSRGGTANASQHGRLAATIGTNLVLMNDGGSGRHIIAAGSAKRLVSWYTWSPDGRYLLVDVSNTETSSSRLVLYNANGTRLRTLVGRMPWAGIYPSWAQNGDEVAYVAGTCATVNVLGCAQRTDEAVFGVDTRGKKRFLGSFASAQGGCGGGGAEPAESLYKTELDFGVTMPTLHWSIGRPLSYLGIALAPPQTARTVPNRTMVSPPAEVAVSPTGVIAATVQQCGKTGCEPYVALIDVSSGRTVRTVARGELPAWSADGRALYFVRRSAGATLPLRDASGTLLNSPTYTTSIWTVDVQGLHPHRILWERAYGFGPLTVSSDGISIAFARVGNDTRLWAHRLSGDRFSPALLRKYGPTVQVQRLDLRTGLVKTIAKNAGRPAIQPQAAA